MSVGAIGQERRPCPVTDRWNRVVLASWSLTGGGTCLSNWWDRDAHGA